MSLSPITFIPDPDYENFLGRGEEIHSLKNLLSSRDRNWVIAVEGLGGIGKSTLAMEVCRYYQRQYSRLPIEERYEYIIWTSAKIDDMTPSGAVLRSEVQATLDAIFNTIADVFEIPDRLTLSNDKLSEKIDLYLGKNRTLLIIDSFEQVENPTAIFNFLQTLPPPSKAIITTRPQQVIKNSDSQVKTIKLAGLNEDDGLRLISTIGSFDLNDSQRREIYKYSMGIPLVIKWALGRLNLNEPYSSIVSKLERGEAIDLAHYCVADSFEFIRGRKAEEIALALMPIELPVSKQTIGEIVSLGKDIKTRDEEISLLLGLQLIAQSKDEKFSLVPLVKATLYDAYEKDARENVIKSWGRYYLEFGQAILGIHGRVDNYTDSLQRIFSEVENIVSILKDVNKYDEMLYCDLLETFRYILYMRGKWIERDIFLTNGREIAQKNSDWCRELLFASDLGWVASYRGEYERALQFFKSAEHALAKCENPYYKAKYLMDLAKHYQDYTYQESDYEIVEKTYFSALENAEKSESKLIQSTCLYYLGTLYHELGNKSEAKNLFERGYEIAKSENALREANRHQSWLALIMAEQGQIREAIRIFERILADTQNYKDKVREADYVVDLAMVQFISKNRQGAGSLLDQAYGIYSNLGRSQDAEDTKERARKLGL